ncbi:hypothetical protein [Deinococcus maricopensis]|uniref:Secreted protein n=1 Tax=Deinococcus maricopensis (strain DSM 21211 / LMG 22137 / NRRL B-23946 / LB-34) TaxID=709986 RepID=E8U3N6_DEIML|nr:hypothetical protein [Deinococcus maricopensis]ADV68660.1 hypothetical protein Deima_3031 [Deinococcus maricopensis DSM 21211]
MNEYGFTLPVGLSTADGRAHREGRMRPATALDEIEPLGDDRVRRNEAYYGLLLLARVVTRLGPYGPLTPDVIAALPAADYAYLQDFYAQLNARQEPLPTTPTLPPAVEAQCPHCHALLEVDLSEMIA